jgi:uncharacterized membrane protein
MTRALLATAALAAGGASLALFFWAVWHWDLLPAYIVKNDLGRSHRNALIGSMVGAAALLSAVGWASSGLRRDEARTKLLTIAKRLSPLVVLGALPFLFRWDAWVQRDLAFLGMTSAVVLALLGTARLAFGTLDPWLVGRDHKLFVLLARTERWLPITIACLSGLFYALFFSYFTIGNHRHLQTSAFDLGIETNLVWNTMSGGPLFKSTPLGGSMIHGGYHQTWFAFVIGPIFRLVPRAETLLVIQSVMLGAATVPFFLVARRRLGPWVAALLSVLFIFYAPLHGSNLYDFHYQPLSVFFLLLTLNLVESRRRIATVIAVVLTLSIREDMGIMLAVLGAYLALRGEHAKAGYGLALVGFAYFALQKFAIMPMFLEGRQSFVNQYRDLVPPGEAGFGSVLKTLAANPGFVFLTLVDAKKVAYALKIMAPLAFLPLRRPLAWVLLLPGFFFTLLSTRYDALLMISFQYTAYWTPFVFLGVVTVLERMGHREGKPSDRRPLAAALCALVVAMFVTSNQYGVVLQQNTAYGAWEKLSFGHTEEQRARYADLVALIDQIPSRAPVSASEFLVAHVAARPEAYALRHGVEGAQYLILHRDLRQDERPHVREALRTGQFGVVEQRGEFVLAKRGHASGKNSAVLRSLRLR